MVKLTKECVFFANSRLIKQIDGCPMGSPVFVALLGICMCKMEEDAVVLAKPNFYKHYVNSTYIRREKNINDELFHNFNSSHKNIKLILEENP